MSFSASVAELVAASTNNLVVKAARWSRVPLGCVATIVNGFPFKSEYFNDQHGTPLIRIRDVTSGKAGTFYAGPIPRGYWVEVGDLVIGMDGDFTSRIWRGERALLNQRVCKIIVDHEKFDKTFLSYLLPAYLQLINDATHSITVKHLSSRTIAEIPLPYPSLAEQRLIVVKLDNLLAQSRRARDEVTRASELADRYKRSVLGAGFRGALTGDWRVAHPDLLSITTEAHNSVRRSRRSGRDTGSGAFEPPFEIPDQWRWIPLLSLGLLDRGRSRHRPRNDPSLYGGPYPFVQTGDVKAARGRLTSYSQTYNERGLEQSRLWPKGTLCITIAANIAETAILAIDACFPDSVVGFTANEAICNPLFVEFFIRTIRDDLAAFAPATAQKNINLETLSAVHVPCPPLNEQTEIVERLEAAFARIDKFVSEAAHAKALLDRLDQALLAKAFRGDLISAEPATQLLDVMESDTNAGLIAAT